MPGLDDYLAFIAPLESADLPYCVTGSIASGIYGETRFTADIDIVVLIRPSNLGLFCALFPEEDFYRPPIEVLTLEIGRESRGLFNLIAQKNQMKADIFVSARDPLHHWALAHRRRKPLGEGGFWIAPPEYVILRKLEAFREGEQTKHPRDIAFMLASTALDQPFFLSQVARLGLQPQWQETLDAARADGQKLVDDWD